MFGFKKAKSYDEVTQQMRKIYYIELATEQLLAQRYQDLSWEQWAYCVAEMEHMPKCVAVGEEGYTVIRDGMTARIEDRMLDGWSN
jgi:hypothetical protein